MLCLRVLIVAAWVVLVSGCGDGDDGRPPRPEPGPGRQQQYAPGTVIGQEVWVPYRHESHAARGVSTQGLGSRDEAREEAAGYRQLVLDGLDIGDVAFRHSHAIPKFVGGYTGVVPRDAAAPDARDRALLAGTPGRISDVIEWEHGFWFGTPVPAEKGFRLKRRFERARHIKARARLIHFHYAHAYPRRFEFDSVSKAEAIASAKVFIARLEKGEDFAKLARERSNDDGTRSRGGTMLQPSLEPGGEPTAWLQWRADGKSFYPYPLLEAVLETAAVGRVMPEPLVTDYGIEVVEVLERRD